MQGMGIAGAVGVPAWLLGCGQSGPTPAAGPAGGAVSQPASVVWLNWEGAGAALEGNTKTLTSFKAKFPQIQVENAAQPAGGQPYWDKHSSLKASGTSPDVWEWEPQNVVDYVLRKQVADLQPLVARDKLDLGDFFPKGIEQYRYRNGLWGFPRDFPNRELTYSVTAFQKEGIKLPSGDWKNQDWTWDAFLDAARRLTKPDGSQFGFNTGKGIRMWTPWVWSNGGEVIDEQKLVCLLDQPAAAEGLQFMQDLIQKHRVWPEAVPQGVSFPGGQIAIQENAPAGLGNLRRDIGEKFVWDAVMHPRGKNGKYVAAGGGAGWAIDASAKSKDAVWALLKHITSSEEQIQLCQLGGTIGSRRSVMTNACFQQSPPKNVKLFVEGADYLHVDVRVAGWSEVLRVIDEELKSLWNGSKPGRQVGLDIKAKIDPILKSEAQKAGG
jgi:multiple sugar transport system substrate-binding protein